jgi:hypothetical protein
MVGSVVACAMQTEPVLAMGSFAFAVRPGRSCKTEKNNGYQKNPFGMMRLHSVPPLRFALV